MKKVIGLALPLMIASASVAFAQSATPGNEPSGKSPAVGAKESYGAGSRDQTGPGAGGAGTPGGGGGIGDKGNYNTTAPSRTGSNGVITNPASAGPKGDSTTSGQ